MSNGTDGGRLRALVIAELANPNWVSVPLEGWSHGQALRGVADVHLVTHVRNRENILAAGLVEGRDFTALDTAKVDRPLAGLVRRLRGGETVGWTTSTAFSALSYYLFEHLLWERFGADLKARRYDVVHRLTPLSPTTPSLLAGRCQAAGVPFVLGPLNGGLPWPKGFGYARRREREWLSYLREGYKLMPGYRGTRRHAAALIAGSRATRAQLPRWTDERTVYIPENAIDPARFGLQVQGPAGRPVRVAFVGRLVPYKGADMLLEAAAPLVKAGRVVLDIIGDGPERAGLQARAKELGVEGGVKLEGWVPHAQLQQRLVQSDVFGFPSVREFGGAVVLEAMALGLVPVVVDYGGPGEHVSPATGFTVPVGPREGIIAGMRGVLERLAEDPSVIRPMGARARERVLSRFTWDAKARQVLEVYRWVTGRRPDRPDFGMPFPDEAAQRAA